MKKLFVFLFVSLATGVFFASDANAQTITAESIIEGYTQSGVAKTDVVVNSYDYLTQHTFPVLGGGVVISDSFYTGSDDCTGTIGISILTASSSPLLGGASTGCGAGGLYLPSTNLSLLVSPTNADGWFIWFSTQPFVNFDPNKTARYFLLYFFDSTAQTITFVPWNELTLTPPAPPEGRTAVITSSQQPAPYPTHVFESTDTINFSFDYQVGSPVISGDVGVKITNLITGTTTRLAKAHTLLSTSFASSTSLEKGYYEYQPFIEVDIFGSIWGGGIQDLILGAPIPIYVEVDPALSPIFAPQTPDFGDISWECDFGWAGDSICQVVGYLFVPSGQSFQEFINLKDSLATVIPFGYFFQAIEIRKKIELPEGVYLAQLPLRAELFSPVDVGMSVIIVILFGWWIIFFFRDIK